jgi:hypothetical protein
MKSKNLLVISLLLFFIIGFISCDNDDVEINQLIGKWTVVINANSYLPIDNYIDFIEYTFNTDGTCIIHTPNSLESPHHTFYLKYVVGVNNNTLTIYKNDMNIMENEVGAGKYQIIKLTSTEMILDSMDNRNKTLKLRRK